MSVFPYSVLSENQQNEEGLERKLLRSKLETLNHTLENLLQKKIRIDLEIKRTKKKLSKLKSSSQTLVRTKVELEGFNYETFSLDDHDLFRAKISEKEYKELLELDREVFIAEGLIQEADELPLVSE